MQLFVPFDPELHYFTLFEDEANHATLRRLAIFDILANSTDRKGGHVLRGDDGHIWAIDNGLGFHHGSSSCAPSSGSSAARSSTPTSSSPSRRSSTTGCRRAWPVLLDGDEQRGGPRRPRAVVADRRFPIDGTGRPLPWPLV